MLEKVYINTPPKNSNSECCTLTQDCCLAMSKLVHSSGLWVVGVLEVAGYWQPFPFAPEEVVHDSHMDYCPVHPQPLGRKEECKCCILGSCRMDLVPEEAGELKGGAADPLPPPQDLFPSWEISCLSTSTMRYKTLWMRFAETREMSPTQTWGGVALKLL